MTYIHIWFMPYATNTDAQTFSKTSEWDLRLVNRRAGPKGTNELASTCLLLGSAAKGWGLPLQCLFLWLIAPKRSNGFTHAVWHFSAQHACWRPLCQIERRAAQNFQSWVHDCSYEGYRICVSCSFYNHFRRKVSQHLHWETLQGEPFRTFHVSEKLSLRIRSAVYNVCDTHNEQVDL
jgi:hypothetical protein